MSQTRRRSRDHPLLREQVDHPVGPRGSDDV